MSRLIKIAVALAVGCGLGAAVLLVRNRPAAAPSTDGKPQPLVVESFPFSESPVFVGTEGVDAAGYPRRVPDRGFVRQAALDRRFDELTRWIEDWQAAFEADPRKEYWPIAALEAFSTADPRLSPVLDEWEALHPDSFVPHAAKGIYLSSIASQRRGAKWARETSAKQFEQMHELHAFAKASLEKALSMRPELVAARRDLISIAMAEGDMQAAKRHVSAALASCPDCLQVRLKYLYAVHPKWGGSLEAMQAFATESAAQADSNPRLAALAGWVDLMECEELRRSERPDDARAACERAGKTGDVLDTHLKKGLLLRDAERYAEATEAFTAALTFWPGHTPTLVERAWSLFLADEWEKAADDVLAALRADPFSAPPRLRTAVINGLIRKGFNAYESGDLDEAISSFDRALDLDPHHPEARGRRLYVLKQRGVTDEDLARFADRFQARPDRFAAVRDLDDALIQRRAFDRIVEAWTTYLSKRPDDPYGYLERSGAYRHWGQHESAAKDAAKACSLGLASACGGAS